MGNAVEEGEVEAPAAEAAAGPEGGHHDPEGGHHDHEVEDAPNTGAVQDGEMEQNGDIQDVMVEMDCREGKEEEQCEADQAVMMQGDMVNNENGRQRGDCLRSRRWTS